MLSCITKEIALRRNELDNQTVETIYFGGGTPSMLSQLEIDQIIQSVYTNHEVINNSEITLEANPDDLSEEKIIALSKSKVNRLSIGVQSFFERDLKLMNRVHNAVEAKKSISIASQYFENISLDLIYGIPGLSNEQWIENIHTALSFGVPHISSYALTLEPKTALERFIFKGIINPLNDKQAQEQFEILVQELERADFANYELSNFGKEGFFSRNNSAYWQGKYYIGIGPSAHSFDGEGRGWNLRNNAKYIQAIQQGELPIEREILSKTDRYNEYIMTGLRTMWGVDLEKIKSDFGVKYYDYLLLQSEKYREQDLLYIELASRSGESDRLKTTQKGKFLSDGISSNLFKLNLS